MADATHQRGFLSLTIDDAKEYFKAEPEEGNRRRSLPITLCGLQWKLEAYREIADGVAWLGVYVVSSHEQAQTWKCKATCVLRISSSLPDDKTIKFCDMFTHDDSQWGPVDSLTIQDVLKPANGYLKNGKITIKCSITASLPHQCEALEGLRGVKRSCTDVKVTIGDRHVYVNKGILAVSCKYFDALFFGDHAARNKDQIALEDVGFDDFTQFLKVVYPPYEAIDGDNIASVMPLADRFGARFILEKCEHFMFREMNVIEAIPILDKCRLSDLKQQLLESASHSDLIELADDAVLETLGRDTMANILKEHRRRSSQP